MTFFLLMQVFEDLVSVKPLTRSESIAKISLIVLLQFGNKINDSQGYSIWYDLLVLYEKYIVKHGLKGS